MGCRQKPAGTNAAGRGGTFAVLAAAACLREAWVAPRGHHYKVGAQLLPVFQPHTCVQKQPGPGRLPLATCAACRPNT